MQSFVPQKILVEQAVADLPLSREIIQKFPQAKVETVEDARAWKKPCDITPAKKILGLAEQRGAALKPFPKIPDAINLGDYVFNPVSNCHLECTYCILQSYLKNNPVLTVFTNVEYFLRAIDELAQRNPRSCLRLGTGELSDSLALDDITGFSKQWVPFVARYEQIYFELKTKSDRIENLLSLESKGHTVVSWSLSPPEIIAREELKCAPLAARLAGARRLARAGYPIGLHLDPLIYFEGWERAYLRLIDEVAQTLAPEQIAWVSLGSLRFDRELKTIAETRFPHTTLFTEDFVVSPAGKLRYFRTIRIEMYRKLWQWLHQWDVEFPRYLCMEPAWMWEKVTGESPAASKVEAQLMQRLRWLGQSRA